MPTSEFSNESGSRARRARKQRRLGPDARCAMCNERNPDSLTTIDRTILEAHHIAGIEHDVKATVILCLNHHAQVTAKQVDAGMSFSKAESLLEKAVAILKSLAALLYVVADMLIWLAAQLGALLQALLEKQPACFDLPEMQPC
jgi:hypothetical protein